jgi:hypothetical protein
VGPCPSKIPLEGRLSGEFLFLVVEIKRGGEETAPSTSFPLS